MITRDEESNFFDKTYLSALTGILSQEKTNIFFLKTDGELCLNSKVDKNTGKYVDYDVYACKMALKIAQTATKAWKEHKNKEYFNHIS